MLAIHATRQKVAQLKANAVAQAAVERAARQAAEAIQRAVDWAMRHPQEMEWIEANMGTEFGASLAKYLNDRGTLTERQVAAIQRKIADAKAATPAPQLSVARIEAAFDVARERGVKKPAMRLDSFVFKAAGASSTNPGAIYVTEEGEYLGKITGGRFIKVRECNEDQQERIVAAATNPDEAARAYGQRTGNCSICGRELTAEESIERFIGPVCAGRYGLA